MDFIKPGTLINFMRYRKFFLSLSALLCALSILGFFYPGPNWGIDFRGGTELHVEFKGDVAPAELRRILSSHGHVGADVVSVGAGHKEYMIRVGETNSLTPAKQQQIQQALRRSIAGAQLEGFDISSGGDKISLKFSADVPVERIAQVLETAGAGVRDLDGHPAVNAFGKPGDHRYEAHLKGVADRIVEQLEAALGARGPNALLGVEWVGPKAGAQLRDAAIKALAYTILFIMVYVALRFDLRFAPGGVVALIHDALITVGVYILLQKEINLTLVAAVLTVVGYSINDTIVVYDRIRENMARMRDMSLRDLINLSTSQTLTRTVMTSTTTIMAIVVFFIWGTAAIRDVTFAMVIGFVVGTYSSVFIAAPITEWMDKRVFTKLSRAVR